MVVLAEFPNCDRTTHGEDIHTKANVDDVANRDVRLDGDHSVTRALLFFLKFSDVLS